MFKFNETFYLLKNLIEQNIDYNEKHPKRKKILSTKAYLREYKTIKFSTFRQSGVTTSAIVLCNLFFKNPIFVYKKDRTKETIVRISESLNLKEQTFIEHSVNAYELKHNPEGYDYEVAAVESDCLIFDNAFLWSPKEFEYYYDTVSYNNEKNITFLFLQWYKQTINSLFGYSLKYTKNGYITISEKNIVK